MPTIIPSQITALVLAGGQGSRLGGEDKGLLSCNGKPLIASIIAGIAPSVSTIIISANRNIDPYEAFGFPVVSDELSGFQGPLAGVLEGLRTAQTEYILTLPCDCPTIPRQLVSRLSDALAGDGDLAVAHDGKYLQPVYALIPVSLANDLEAFLNQGHRKLRQWLEQHALTAADFSDQPAAFDNINTEVDRIKLCGNRD